MKVLVVDDQPEIRSVLAQYLHSRACGVEVASTRGEAYRQLTRSRFDVLVTDLHLDAEEPQGGLLVAAMARQLSPGIVAIMLTGDPEGVTAGDARRAGVAAVLRKPSGLGALWTLITSLLENADNVEAGGATPSLTTGA